MKFVKIKNMPELVIGVCVSLFVFIVYLFTLAPTVTFIDSGELAAVASTLGIAHPTGYPLFTIIGWIFSNLPIASTVIYKLNVMSAFFSSLSIFFFFKLILLISNNYFSNTTVEAKNVSSAKKYLTYIPAISSSLILAFSKTFWSQATAIEVYSLHALFLSLILFLFLKANLQRTAIERINKNEINKTWFLFTFILGLSFTNHLTTILLAPALLYMYFVVSGFSKNSLKNIFRLTIPFIIGLSVYLYLPVRASSVPLINWGNPVDLEKILWHVSGKQYRVWIFSSTESAAKQLNYFINELPNEFNFVFLLIAMIGIWYIFTKSRQLFIFSLLLFVGCVLYSINYDIHDIDSYFLLAYLTLTLWITFGIQWIIEKIKTTRALRVISVSIVVVSIIPFFINIKQNDESKNHLVEDYTKNMFGCIEPNGVIISYQWDYFVSATYYFQFVDNYRTDVIVIDKELLRRSWYYKQLQKLYPELIKNSQPEIEAFLIELYKFEHDLPYSYEIIEQRYTNLIRSFIERNIDNRPIYVTAEIEPQYLQGFEKIPTGLCFQLVNPQKTIPGKEYVFNYRRVEKSDKNFEIMKGLYSRAYETNAAFQVRLNNKAAAIKYLDAAIEINPGNVDLRAKRNYLLKLKENTVPPE